MTLCDTNQLRESVKKKIGTATEEKSSCQAESFRPRVSLTGNGGRGGGGVPYDSPIPIAIYFSQ